MGNVISNFTQKYVGDPDYQFGLAIYGDFKRRGKVGENDPLDFKVVHELQPNYGDLFENLSEYNSLILVFLSSLSFSDKLLLSTRLDIYQPIIFL